ncbi:uncharacterized protein [Hemitrygon akajei]|uniref:uncharacterized protein n=1 Tax=Hemitrygon akajei TaxID=2704970 RepID=UPI003BF9DAE1
MELAVCLHQFFKPLPQRLYAERLFLQESEDQTLPIVAIGKLQRVQVLPETGADPSIDRLLKAFHYKCRHSLSRYSIVACRFAMVHPLHGQPDGGLETEVTGSRVLQGSLKVLRSLKVARGGSAVGREKEGTLKYLLYFSGETMEVGAILWLLTVSSGIGAEKFVVIQDKSSIVATEGETVDIPCRHNVTNRVWSYHWVKGARNGIKVTSETAEYRDRFLRSPGGDLSNNSTDVSMRLKYVRPSDSGMYFCKLETIEWEIYGAGTNLTVRGIGAEKFVVIQDKSSIVATEGEMVDIPCRHNVTNTVRSYHWFKGARNGIEVTNETAEYRDRFLIPQGGDPSTNSTDVSLRLKYVLPSDSGMYFCKLKIIEWTMYGSGTYLTVRGKSRSFTVTQGQSSIFVAEGETVLMVCSHNANHSGDTGLYSWYRNTSEVSNGMAEYAGRVLGPDQEDSFKASIKLVDVRESDSGMYYCKVRIDGIGEAIGEGVRLTVSHTRKLTHIVIHLVILLVAFGIQGSILLISILFRRKILRAENQGI